MSKRIVATVEQPQTDETKPLFGPWMQPLNKQARELGERFCAYVVWELHERGVHTAGLPVSAKRISKSYGMEMMAKNIGSERLTHLLARTYFYGKERTPADLSLCQTLAIAAVLYGIIG